MEIKIKKLSDKAILPTQANPFDAGYDLFSTETVAIMPGQRKLLRTDLSIAIPEGYYGRIADRSGNAYKLGIHVLGGVIDSAYRGNVGVILLNTNEADMFHTVTISKGDRIAQLIIEKCHDVQWKEVEEFPTEVKTTARGEGGFGSTGK